MRLPCVLASLLVALPLAAPARPAATARTLWTGPAGTGSSAVVLRSAWVSPAPTVWWTAGRAGACAWNARGLVRGTGLAEKAGRKGASVG